MFVNFKYSKDVSVVSPNNKLDYFLLRIRQIISKLFIKTLITNNPILHSLSLFSSNLLKKINENDADIVHLHWVQHEMLSISDITKINKPILWTIHDMWPFCGAEHISMHNRWVEGYNFNNRPVSEKGFDINRWIWQKKKRYWTKPLNLVSPSSSHAKLIKMSALMHRWPLSVIPNPIDVNFWRPLQKQSSRKKLKLSIDSQLLLFTSMTNGKNFYNKGVDIFLDLIKLINTKSKFRNLELVILGKYNKIFNEIDIPIHSFEFVNDACKGVECLINLASTVVPSTSNRDPIYDVNTNLIGALNTLQASVKNNVSKYIFLSSGGTVYGSKHSDKPHRETDPTEPICSYGIVKLSIEKYIHMFNVLHGLPYSIIRLSNPYGPEYSVEKPQGAIHHFISKTINQKKLGGFL